MKKVAILFGLIIFCLGIGKGIHWARKGFTLRRIAAPVQTKLEIWESAADLIIEQPFHYIGRGRQCFAFASLDGKYVLKLPRTDIYQTPFWMRALPSNQKEIFCAARAAREKFVLNSMQIAYEELREETGVLAIHFGVTPDLGKKIAVIDRLGILYHLPANNTAFVLQAKYPILMKAFAEELHLGHLAEAKQILNAFIDVVIARGSRGIWNKDESFLRNYGFDGQKGYQIDIGSFYRKADGAASIRDTMHPVRTWLEKANPEMLAYFESELEKKLRNLSK